MAERETFAGAHDDHAVDSQRYVWNSALEPLCSPGGPVLARPTKPTSKSRGRWTYLYRAATKRERRVDVLLRAKRADRRGQGVLPTRLSGARGDMPPRSRSMAIRPLIVRPVKFSAEHPERNRCEIRSSKYLNNLIEQDHRSIKLRLSPMLARLQAFSESCNDDRRHRTHAPDQKEKGQFKLA